MVIECGSQGSHKNKQLAFWRTQRGIKPFTNSLSCWFLSTSWGQLPFSLTHSCFLNLLTVRTFLTTIFTSCLPLLFFLNRMQVVLSIADFYTFARQVYYVFYKLIFFFLNTTVTCKYHPCLSESGVCQKQGKRRGICCPWLLKESEWIFNENEILKAKLCYFYKFKCMLPIGAL